ncbi:MAG: hypothetical protein OEM39_01705 [Acidimicrobiia bacterium]|nr:hypothetical protein [Acidimicrobiia bacterium]MDH3462729.1 hypothetical protein [Acidimicrobiia bacterium]
MTEPYVLFDMPEGDGAADIEFLEGLGHRVVVCNGPSLDHPCPILEGDSCQLVEGAHAVVFGLDLDRAKNRAVLARYRGSLRDDIPIRVVARADQIDRNAPLLEGIEVSALPETAEEEADPDD